MTKKIFVWVWLILGIAACLTSLINEQQESRLFVLIYFLGMNYIFIKYLETLK